MAPPRGAGPRVLLWLRTGATIGGWFFLIVYAHRLWHGHQSDIERVLASPVLRLAVTTLLLTALVYVVVLTLPSVPNLGPRGVGVVFVWTAVLVLADSFSRLGSHEAQAMVSSVRDAMGSFGLVLLAAGYAVALAVPFVPGVELGLLVMIVFGPPGAIAAYAATVGGLSLAYAVGRGLPERVTMRMLDRIGIAAPRDDPTSVMRGLVAESRLGRSAPRRLRALLFDYRYLTLAVALNFPGNSVLGGGGGLAVLCGLSRQFTWRSFLLTVALATAPVPALMLVGLLTVDPLLEYPGFLHSLLTWVERLFIQH